MKQKQTTTKTLTIVMDVDKDKETMVEAEWARYVEGKVDLLTIIEQFSRWFVELRLR